MATEIVMPRQGNSVESCIIISWKKKEGDSIKVGESICEVETDKATFDVESTAEGVVLKMLHAEGDDVPVLTPIVLVGSEGEQVQEQAANASQKSFPAVPDDSKEINVDEMAVVGNPSEIKTAGMANGRKAISPRAKNRAISSSVDLAKTHGTGPGGRIIERDIDQYLKENEPLTPAAKELLHKSALTAPRAGSGIGGRILSADLVMKPATVDEKQTAGFEEVSVKGVRKLISERMLNSLQTTAQLTINASANAVQVLELRKRFKDVKNNKEVNGISINDLVLFAVARSVVNYKEVNAHFYNDKIVHYNSVNLAFAVDTPKGLMVPVIRSAEKLSLKAIAQETQRLGNACNEGKILPDELNGATITVTNLGSLGIESFTPVLNPPEVCILGICSIQLKPVMVDHKVDFIPHMGLSLTFNHQALDGAPAARFLNDITKAIANVDLLLLD